MSIRLKGKQYQADIMIKGTRFRKSFPNSYDAEMWEDELRRRKALGLDIGELVNEEPMITLEEAMEKTYHKYWKNTDSAYGNSQKMREINSFFPRDTLLCDVTTSAIDDFIDWLQEKGNADATINNKLNIISKTFTWAKLRGIHKDAPHIERKKLKHGKPRVFNDWEIGAIREILGREKPLIEGIDNQIFLDFFDFSLESGMRSSEVQNFNKATHMRQDPTLGYVVDIEETKNDLYRCNPMTHKMLDIATKYSEDKPFDLVTQKRRFKVWRKVRELLQIDDPEWIMYLTRHTCATRLVSSGVSIMVIQKYMGHRKIETTLRYATTRPEDLMTASLALNNKSYQINERTTSK